MSETLLLTDQTQTAETVAIQTIEPVTVSVFDCEKFPVHGNSRGRPWSITPAQWLKCCESYELGNTIYKACESVNIPDPGTYYLLVDSFTELSQRHAQASRRRTHVLAEQTIKIADNCPTENMAAVRKAENQAKVRQWLIERHNPEQYSPKSTLDIKQTGFIVHAHTNIKPDQLMQSGPMELPEPGA